MTRRRTIGLCISYVYHTHVPVHNTDRRTDEGQAPEPPIVQLNTAAFLAIQGGDGS